MDNNSQLKPRFVLFFYILLVILNGLYVIRIRSVADINIMSKSWFVILPMLFYFYLAFAIIAGIGLFYRKTLGLMLGYCVLMFGNVMAVVSYSVIYQNEYFMEILIVPLIAVNLCVIFYMAFNHSYYKDD